MGTTFAEAIEGQPMSWVTGYARKVAPSSVDPEDLIAEGMYAMWLAYEKRDERKNVSSYLIQAAKWQILRVLDRRRWTGQDKTRAPGGINSTGVIHADQVEQYYPSDIMGEWSEVAVEAELDASDLSDIRADVRDAVASLPESQRDRVFRKYWLDEPVWLSGNWWRDSKWGARARLRAELQHLNTGEWQW